MRLKRSFFFGAVSMIPKSNELQRLPKLQSYLRCSSFQRLALICLSLNLIGICVPRLDLFLRTTRAPTRKIRQVFQSRTISQALAHPVCPCRYKKQERALFCNQVPMSCKTPRQEKSNHYHCKDDAYHHLSYAVR